MSEIFYHVDRHTGLNVGSTMDLEWPGKITDELSVRQNKENDILRDYYPKGLSRHGARYAQAGLISEDVDRLNPGWEAMTAIIKTEDQENGEKIEHIAPHPVQYEFFFELYRMLEFKDKLSRFQSYFAFEDLYDAKNFAREHRNNDLRIFRVECNDYDIRDMNILKAKYFGHIFNHGEDYWKGEAGSENPTWEVVMEPPVEVVDTVS